MRCQWIVLVYALCLGIESEVFASGDQATITTIAGGVWFGDGDPATQAELRGPTGVAVDASGNIYIADTGNDRIRCVDAAGNITTIAGVGTVAEEGGFSGDGGPANQASLGRPTGIAIGPNGNIYIAEEWNNTVRRISSDGSIATIAGKAPQPGEAPFPGPSPGGFSGDGGLATQALLNRPTGVAVDSKGNIYIADSGNHRVRRVAADGRISTFAGTGAFGASGDGGPATQALLSFPSDVAVDNDGNVYIGDAGNLQIRRVDGDGIITRFAETRSLSSTGGSFVVERIGLAVDSKGNVCIADAYSNRILRVGSGGVLQTLAGSSSAGGETGGFSGDGGLATLAGLSAPNGVAVDSRGIIYIADKDNDRIRRVGSDGIISTVAGGQIAIGDGKPATKASVFWPRSIAEDSDGNLYIADDGHDRIRRVSRDGIISTFAGGGSVEDGEGDGGPATQAELYSPGGVALSSTGEVYIADTGNDRIRRVGLDGIISAFAGIEGEPGYSGDGGLATQAEVEEPMGIAVDSKAVAYIADTENNCVRRVEADGIITAFAGTGEGGVSGDGGLAVRAQLNEPTDVAVDFIGAVFVADKGNNRIRHISADGIITTFAGSGSSGFSGDNGPAVQAGLDGPFGVALDRNGVVYIADSGNHRIRRVGLDGMITTFAGTGTSGFSGDGGPATEAMLNTPKGVMVDAQGGVYIADTNNHRIRRIIPAGTGLPSDFDGSGKVDFDDFFLFAGAFGKKAAEAGFEAKFDLDQNGVVDFNDFFTFADDFGKVAE